MNSNTNCSIKNCNNKIVNSDDSNLSGYCIPCRERHYRLNPHIGVDYAHRRYSDKIPKRVLLLRHFIKYNVFLIILFVILQAVLLLITKTMSPVIVMLIPLIILNMPIAYVVLKYSTLSRFGITTSGVLHKAKSHFAPQLHGGSSHYKTYSYSFRVDDSTIHARETDYFNHEHISVNTYDETRNKKTITYLKHYPHYSTIFNPTRWLRKKRMPALLVTFIVNGIFIFLNSATYLAKNKFISDLLY